MSTTIATPGGVAPSGYGQTRHVIWAVNSGRWWAFAFTSTTVVSSWSSTDGINWSAGATHTVSTVVQDGRLLYVGYKNISGLDVVHFGYGIGSTTQGLSAFRATISGSTVTYHTTDTAIQAASINLTNKWYGGSVEFTSGNLVFIASTLAGATGDTYTARSTADPGTSEQATAVTWSGVNTSIDTGSADNRSNYLADTGATTMLLLADNEATDQGTTEIRTYKWSGSAWGANASATGTITSIDKNDWGAVAVTTSDVHMVYRSGTSSYVHRRWNGTSWGAGQTIPAQASVAGSGVALASDGTSAWLFVIDSAAGNAVQYVQWTAGAWGSWATLEATSQTRTFVACSKEVGNGQVMAYWSESTALVATALTVSQAAPGSSAPDEGRGHGRQRLFRILNRRRSVFDVPLTSALDLGAGKVDGASTLSGTLSVAEALTAGSAPATGALSTVTTSTNAGAYQRPANDKVVVLWDGSLVIADYDGSTGHVYQVTNPSTNPVVTSLQTFTEDNLSLCVLNGASSSDLWVLATGDLVGGATAHVRHALYSGGTFTWDASTLVANTIQANSNDCSIVWTGTWLIAMWWDGVGSSSNDQVAYSWTTVKAGTSGWSAAAKFDPAGTSTTIWQVNLRYSAKLAATVAVYGGNSKMHYSILKDSAVSPARANWTTMADLDAGFDDTYAQFGGPSVVVDEATGKIHVARAVCNSGGPTWFGVTYWLGTPDATPMVTPSISWSSRLIIDSAGSASSPTDIAAGLDNSGKLWVFWTDAVSAGNLKYATLVSPYISASSATTFVSTGTPRYPHVPSSVLSYIPLVYQTGTASPWSIKLDTTLGAQSVPVAAPSLAWLSSLSAVLITGTPLALAGQLSASSTLIATMALTEALAGSEASTSNLSSASKEAVALAAPSVAGSGLSASLVEAAALASNTAAASSFSASLTLTSGTAFAGTAASISVESATLLKAEALAASSNALSVSSASLSEAEVLQAATSSASTVSGSAVFALALNGSIVSASSTTVTAGLAEALAVSTSVLSASTATLAEAEALAASSAAASVFSANLQVLSGLQVAGSVSAGSSLTATAKEAVALATVATAGSGISATLGLAVSVSASAVAGSTIIAVASETVSLAVGSASLSVLSANLQILSGAQVAGALASVSSASATAALSISVSASTAAVSSFTPNLGLAAALVVRVTSSTTASGNLLAPMLFTGTAASVSVDRGTLLTVYAIAASSSSVSTLKVPGLGGTVGLQGLIAMATSLLLNPIYRDITLELGQPLSRWQMGRPGGRWQSGPSQGRWLTKAGGSRWQAGGPDERWKNKPSGT